MLAVCKVPQAVKKVTKYDGVACAWGRHKKLSQHADEHNNSPQSHLQLTHLRIQQEVIAAPFDVFKPIASKDL